MLTDLRTMSDLDKVKENHEEFITELNALKEDLQAQYNNTIANNKEANKYHRKIQVRLLHFV